ncbi:MAG: hypothetical protein NZ765_12385, partial [Anaerolineae bacterium]|nr:hypothetical protein [Anaerolineae bacterium]
MGAVPGVAEGQGAQPGASIAGSPLVTRQVMAAQVGSMTGAQTALAVDVLHVHQDEREGLHHLPRLLRRVDTVSPQDVADGV